MTTLQPEPPNNKHQPLYLHLGCGETIIPEFINLDIRDDINNKIDKLSLVYPLDYNDNTFSLVYSSHILEHFPRNQTKNILQEWVRVLKPGGTLRISVPSLENLLLIYEQTKELDQIIGPLYGGQNYKYNYHHTVFDKKTLTSIMESVNLEAVHTWDYKRTIHSKYWDYSQAETKGISISLNLEGRKIQP